jgi:hypothetical protein
MEENKKIQCKNCKGWYTLFMSHLKKKTDCQKAYGEGYERMLELKAQKKKDYLKEYLKDYLEDYREENKHQLREQNAEYRAANKDVINQKRAANKDVINQKRAENKDTINKKRTSQRNLDRKKRNMKEKEYPYYQKKKIKLSRTSNDRILAFKRQIIDGPNFTCYSCKATLYKSQVRIFKANNISNLIANLEKKFVKKIGLQFKRIEVIFCHNCHKLIKLGKMPKIHFSNGLKLDKVPDELKLTDLEQQTIARSLIFIKVKKLPTSRMKAMFNKCISVPIEEDDITKTITALPQHPDDAKVVAVQLKRKIQWKNSHLEHFIRPAKCVAAVQKLKKLGNPFYKYITINENFMDKEKVYNI